ncbi:flippase [Candidatus Aciduliprofundum boonei]|uniref:Polysaccharide biosynthesis protein n=1 Tax=Aciduliprofundum boonei (strain DSM 19572 / T469) TaxID=439481 RepID=B5IDJ0_ACIB4|nr:flippase [Candidatus Aciduliprofundum boonei]ADD08065.1 polysaccharide biosynthesis protein [Aciduliprofundum boonei T469]EDY35630.1 Virulence factor MVIN superfamily [Aciduliprofundum boonei T469]
MGKTVSTIAKNTGILFLSRIISKLFGFFYLIYTVRYLGPANYGILAFALALNGIFRVLINFGIDPLYVREIARNKKLAPKYLANGIVLKTLLGALTFLIIALIVNFLEYPYTTVMVVYIITITWIVGGIINLFVDLCNAFEKMEFVGMGQILQSILFLVFTIIAIVLRLDVIHFAFIYIIVYLIILGYYGTIITLKFIRITLEADWSLWKYIIKDAWPFALTSFFVGVYYYTDSIMLSFIKSNFEVGIYNAAYKLSITASFIPFAYLTSIYPRISMEYKRNHNKFEKMSLYSVYIMGFFGMIIMILGYLLAQPLIIIIYGYKYINSIPIFQILIISIGIGFLTQTFGYLLNASNNQKLEMYIMLVGILLNIALNYALISIKGAVGAAFATLITRIFLLIVRGSILKKKKIITSYKISRKDLRLIKHILTLDWRRL